MPLVQITIVQGRSKAAIDDMAEAVTEAIVSKLGASRSAIRVAINEIPTEHWYIAGVSIADKARSEILSGPSPVQSASA